MPLSLPLTMFGAFSGGVAEWSKATVLKTVERKLRRFESYRLRHKSQPSAVWIRRGDREADGARLLSECRFTATEGSNPSLSAILTAPAGLGTRSCRFPASPTSP